MKAKSQRMKPVEEKAEITPVNEGMETKEIENHARRSSKGNRVNQISRSLAEEAAHERMTSARQVILVARSGVLDHIIEKMAVLQLKEVAVIPESLGVSVHKDRLNELDAIHQVVKVLERCSCLVNEAAMIPFSLAMNCSSCHIWRADGISLPSIPLGCTFESYLKTLR